ncbi:MAG: hypothetical protein QM723_34795 [Myxococcaceae bacterium]
MRAAWLAVFLWGSGAFAAAPPRLVAVDLSALDHDAFEKLDAVALESRIVVRLVQEGYAVVALRAAPEARLEVRLSGSAIVLDASMGAERARREVPMREVPLKELHLEVAQKAVALLREVEARVPPRVGAPAEPPPLPPDAGTPAPAPHAGVVEPSGEPFPTRVEVRGGAVGRLGGVDPFVGLAFRFPLVGALRGWVEGAYIPGVNSTIAVQDGAAALGVGWAFELSDAVGFEPGVRVGGYVHTFRLADARLSQASGVRGDFVALIPLDLRVRLLDRFVLGLRVAPGFTSRGREHTVEGAKIYERGAFLVEAGLSLGLALDKHR